MQLNKANTMKPTGKPAPGRLFSSSMLANSIATGVSAIVTFATARILGAEGRGQIAVVTTVAGYAIIALGLSLESGVLYYGGQVSVRAMQNLRHQITLIVAWTILACSLVLFVTIQFLGVPLSFATSLLFALGCASTIAVAPVTPLDRVEGRHHAATWRPVWVLVAQQAGGLIGLEFGKSVERYLIASGAFSILVTILMLELHRRNRRQLTKSDTGANTIPCPSIRELVSYSVRGHGGVLLHLYTMRLPLIILSVSIGAAAAGNFSIATAIVETILIITQSQLAYVLAAANANRNNFSVLKSQMRLGFYLSLVIGLLLVPASSLASRLLGHDFAGLQVTVGILIPGVIALGLWRLASYDLATRGLAHLRSQSGLVGAVLVTVLAFALVGRYGTNGGSSLFRVGGLVDLEPCCDRFRWCRRAG